MKRSKWPLLVGALVIGALAGIALAGRPESLPSVVIPASTAATSTTAADDSTTSSAESTTSSTTSPPTTAATSSTAAIAVVTSASTSSSTPAQTLRATQVVVVNSTGRQGLAGRAADALRAQGWTEVHIDDSRDRLPASRVMANPGFEEAARLAAQELGLTVHVEPFDPGVALIGTSTGDVMVFLGPEVNF